MRERIRIRYNKNGAVEAFVGSILVVAIVDDQVKAPLGLGFGDIDQAEALLECYGKAIEAYRKNSSPDLAS